MFLNFKFKAMWPLSMWIKPTENEIEIVLPESTPFETALARELRKQYKKKSQDKLTRRKKENEIRKTSRKNQTTINGFAKNSAKYQTQYQTQYVSVWDDDYRSAIQSDETEGIQSIRG